jgi:hypothetical protein
MVNFLSSGVKEAQITEIVAISFGAPRLNKQGPTQVTVIA